ncbi:MAG: tunicamycin resistance protein [Tissierellia bacterium]|nr:tunicamycin resistance protein [Tissierellia bacterium]
MIIWINGAFGSGKTTCAFELNRRLKKSIIYDPENVGYFIRKNIPKELHEPDFQDHKEWRSFNFEMLTFINTNYDRIIIVPMTLTNRKYYEEIITRLIDNKVEVKHSILSAEKETLEKCLKSRLESKNSWANQQIDRCINSFNKEITEEKILTDSMSIDSIVEEIAKRSGIILSDDNRSYIRKKFDRLYIFFKNIK